MKILVLEDDGHRAKVFVERFYTHQLTITENAYDAVELLDSNVYDTIFLDHDLGEGNGSGSYVTAYLKENPDNPNNQARIVIHSWNIPAAMRMIADVPYADFAPFNTDEFYTLKI